MFSFKRDDAAALERQRITELLVKNDLDLSTARILFLERQRVEPLGSVLWLEHNDAPSAIWEPLPAGLVVLSAVEAEVRSWASAWLVTEFCH